MPSKKLRITIYLTPEEHTRIATSAKRTCLSLSTFAKRVCLGHEVPSLEHLDFWMDIRRLRGDLGRLGGLLKLALTEEKGPAYELRRLLQEFEKRQQELREALERVRESGS